MWANASRASRRRVGRATARRRRAISASTALVVGGIDDDADVGVVLRRGADHRRTADVDQLDAGVARERIEVDDDEIDRLDAVLGHVGLVLGHRRVGEHAAVDLRMQRHHTVAEDRRHPGELGDVGHRRPRRRRSPAPCRRSTRSPAEVVRAPRRTRRCRICRTRRAARWARPERSTPSMPGKASDSVAAHRLGERRTTVDRCRSRQWSHRRIQGGN